MAQTDTRPRHVEIGLSDEAVLAMYRAMLLARAVDERMWLVQRAEARPEPSSDDAHERVYADPIPGGGTATPLAPMDGHGGSH